MNLKSTITTVLEIDELRKFFGDVIPVGVKKQGPEFSIHPLCVDTTNKKVEDIH